MVEFDWFDAAVIVLAGTFAGFINAIAAGGSLLVLPVLIFMGLESSVANGTNRIAIFFQNIFAVSGYRSKGVHAFPYSIWLAISALFGAIIGANIAVDLDDRVFNRVLSVVLLLAVVLTIFSPKKEDLTVELMSNNRKALAVLLFFFIGIYGGFIQAGVGFIIILALSHVNNFTLLKANSVKVFVVLVYTAVAIYIFAKNGKIHWAYAAVLATGNSLGAWVGSRWASGKGDVWIKRIIIVTVSALAIKLWFF